MGSGQSTKRQKVKSSPFDRDPKDRRSLKCFRKSNGNVTDKAIIRSRSASTSSLGTATRPASLPHLPIASSTPVKKPNSTISPLQDSWSRITMPPSQINDCSRVSEGTIGTAPQTPSSAVSQSRNNSMGNNSMVNNTGQSPSRTLNKFIFDHHQQQALSNIARNSLKELNEKTKREIFEENYRVIKDFLIKHYSPDLNGTISARNSKLFEKSLLLRDLSRDQSINSHETSITSISSTRSERENVNKSLPKTRDELQELTSIESRLKSLIDYCSGGSAVQGGGDTGRGNSFNQQLVTVSEKAQVTTTTTPGISNYVSFNQVTRTNINQITGLNTNDNCRGNDGNGIKLSFKLSYQDGRDRDQNIDHSLNLSLDKVIVLIRERKSYLEKRLELESLHSRAVRELIRDPNTPSLTMASLQNWNAFNPAIGSPASVSSHPFPSSFSAMNGSIVPKLRKPRALSLVESADGNLGFDSSSYCNLMQDVKDVKTLLFRLQGLLQLTEQQQEELANGHGSINEDVTNIVQENQELRRQVQQFQKTIEEKDANIRLLQSHVSRLERRSNRRSSEKSMNGSSINHTDACLSRLNSSDPYPIRGTCEACTEINKHHNLNTSCVNCEPEFTFKCEESEC